MVKKQREIGCRSTREGCAGLSRLRRRGRLLWRCRNGGRGGCALLENRAWRALAIVQDDEQHARRHERGGENRGRPGQQILRRTAGHKPRHAAPAHAERTPLALLQQDHPDERDRDKDVNGEEQDQHRVYLFTLYAADQNLGLPRRAALCYRPEIIGIKAGAAD